MSENEFKSLFNNELLSILDAKNQIVSTLPRLIEQVKSQELKDELKSHLEESQNQIERLKQILQRLSVDIIPRDCLTMKELLKEGEQALRLNSNSAVQDAILLSIAQRIAHYEMAVYGALRSFAKELGYSGFADLLQTCLDEEGNANKKLTKIAEGGFFTSGVNRYAIKY